MVTEAPRLTGYRVGPVLRRDRERVLYHAREECSGEERVIETLASDYPSRRQLAEIRRDGRIARALADVDGVLQVHAVETCGRGRTALVTEPVTETLSDRLARAPDGRVPLAQGLTMGGRIAEILDGLHARGMVHKAVTPDHIRLPADEDSPRLTGFGLASELGRERQGSLEAGSRAPLPYLSPEQTGRMNRELDYRSDFYSLGVTLFEALAGQRPFTAEGVLEWVHAHISQTPPDPGDLAPDLPPAVARILLRLLTKDPEHRYQTGAGLARDLAECAEAVASGTGLEDFEPARHDRPSRFLLPQRLYGRERELDELAELFESAAAGGTELCLVHGYSGVGKSALVNEIDRPLVRERGFFARGKFDQFHQGAYSAMAAAFRTLVQQLLAEPEARLARWKQRLNEALSPNAQLVLDLVPELELIIGPQPPVAELPPDEARNRNRIVLADFVRVFAGRGHPLVLFIDDLQWSDGPTRDLIRQLALSRDTDHLLIIGAYRSNEVPPGHPLHQAFEAVRAGRPVHDLPVAPLDRDSIRRMVADTLQDDEARVRPLGDLVHDKARGNPFFTGELLQTLHDEGVIRPGPDGGWTWDTEAALWAGLSGDIVEFMIDNLRKLPEATGRVLQLAACIGNTFELETLAVISECPATEVAETLMPALRQHTIVPLHADYRLVGHAPDDGAPEENRWNPVYRFAHDRVQQAAYRLSDARAMTGVHLSIGRLMRRHSGDAIEGDRLMEMVRHLNAGRSLIEDPEERLALARFNLRAGIRARNVAAYETAYELLHVGHALLPEPTDAAHPELAFELARELQQCAYLTGRQDEAEEWAGFLFDHAPGTYEKVELLSTRTRQYATLGRMEASMHTAIEGLRLLGVEIHEDPGDREVAEERARITEHLGDRAIADLLDAPNVEDRSVLLAMRLLMEIFPASFLSGSGNLFPYLVFKGVNLSLRHGNCPEAAFIHAAYGMLLCGELDDPALGLEYGRLGLAINERFDDLALRARVIYVYAMFIHHWSHHWSSLTPWFRRGIEAGHQSGDLLYLAYSAQDCVIWDPALDLPEATRQHEENIAIVRECNYRDSLDSATLFLQMQYAFQGLTRDPLSLSDERFDEHACLDGMHQRQFMTGVANYHIYKAEVAVLHDAPEHALEHLARRQRLIRSAMSLPQLARFYLLDFLACVRVHPDRVTTPDDPMRHQLLEDLDRIRRWADHCPDNFLHLQYLMEAELERLSGSDEPTMERYEAAIEAAAASGFMRDEAMASERAASHLLDRGRRRAAEGYLRAAHRLYARWGARRKVRLLEERHPVLEEIGGPGSDHGDDALDHKDLDLASIMKASRAISGEIETEKLLRTSLEILLENAGGQWACLIRRDRGLPGVEAMAGELPQAPPGPELELEPGPCPGAITPDGSGIALPISLVSHVLGSGEPVVLDNASQEGAFTDDPAIAARQVVSVLCVPLGRERFVGALYMENNLTAGAFPPDRAEVVRLLAAQAAVALENARLYEQVREYSRTLEDRVAERTRQLEEVNRELQNLAERDGLTGLANRRRGDDYLQEQWDRLGHEQRPLSLIMFDVDHFKPYNDHYGHPAGDHCLITIGSIIRETLDDPEQLAVRYGGEEFMVILPGIDTDAAHATAERLRGAILEQQLPHEYSTTADVVTVSIGTATRTPSGLGGRQDLINEADEALYRAKKAGRNRVVGPADTRSPDPARESGPS
ncbi:MULTISPECIES: diguanylate cyclase [unclassified Thioalkalivibrio]|uniref:diguanylate cyclase n=1 Tax=unclassified Thioalkalivibrio TaxID=2621013 RepID=UPI00036153C5|nr:MULTISPECIES: diguanylate cyclase [unclassified Thioalkalivibrio]